MFYLWCNSMKITEYTLKIQTPLFLTKILFSFEIIHCSLKKTLSEIYLKVYIFFPSAADK